MVDLLMPPGGPRLLVMITATYMRPLLGMELRGWQPSTLHWSFADIGLARCGDLVGLAARHDHQFIDLALKSTYQVRFACS